MSDIVGIPVNLPYGLIECLGGMITWHNIDNTLNLLLNICDTRTQAQTVLEKLIMSGIIIERGCDHDHAEKKFSRLWPYGLSTASHLLAADRTNYFTKIEEIYKLADLIKANPKLGRSTAEKISVGDPYIIPTTNLTDPSSRLFRKRRSARRFNNRSLPQSYLGSILKQGLGITEVLNLAGRPQLFLRNAPSPGGFASLSGFVFIRNVDDLESGFYVYNHHAYTLSWCENQLPQIDLAALIGHQSWADDAAVVIILVSDVSVVASKYQDPGAFDASLIEAGHIAQIIALAAETLDWSTVFSNALNSHAMAESIGLTWPTYLPLYAIAIGHKGGIDNPAEDYNEDDLNLLQQLLADS